MLALVLMSPIFLLLLGWLYKELTMGICYSKKRLDSKTVLITGGNSGIGYETALDLAKRGAHVIIASRNIAKSEKAASSIAELSGNKLVEAKMVDMSSLKSVREFVEDLRVESIDILINNSGYAGDFVNESKEKKLNKSGFENIMATNYLGSSLLTLLLLEKVKKAGRVGEFSRIVHVSSVASYSVKEKGLIDLQRIVKNKRPIDIEQYQYSKLFQILFSNALARRLQGSYTESVSLHPGVVRTPIFDTAQVANVRKLMSFITWWLGKSAEQGCQTSLQAALADESMNGRFLSDCRDTIVLKHSDVGNVEVEEKLFRDTASIVNFDL